MKRSHPFSLAARAAARAADEKKASDVLLYDVSRSSSLADFILIVTVESTAHAGAVEDAMDEAVLDVLGAGRVRRDGGGRVSWRVLDYGGLIVHLMSESLREFYGLERLWESVRPVAWKKKV